MTQIYNPKEMLDRLFGSITNNQPNDQKNLADFINSIKNKDEYGVNKLELSKLIKKWKEDVNSIKTLYVLCEEQYPEYEFYDDNDNGCLIGLDKIKYDTLKDCKELYVSVGYCGISVEFLNGVNVTNKNYDWFGLNNKVVFYGPQVVTVLRDNISGDFKKCQQKYYFNDNLVENFKSPYTGHYDRKCKVIGITHNTSALNVYIYNHALVTYRYRYLYNNDYTVVNRYWAYKNIYRNCDFNKMIMHMDLEEYYEFLRFIKAINRYTPDIITIIRVVYRRICAIILEKWLCDDVILLVIDYLVPKMYSIDNLTYDEIKNYDFEKAGNGWEM